MKNRKQPTNAPATRGEFEHLTSMLILYTFCRDNTLIFFFFPFARAEERYEALMQAYGVPLSGDINAKRETLRAFLGIPSVPLEKK